MEEKIRRQGLVTLAISVFGVVGFLVIVMLAVYR